MLWLNRFVLLIAVVAIAWPSAPPRAANRLAGSEWKVVEIAGKPVEAPLTMRFDEGRVSGRSACNSYAGTFGGTSGRLEIGRITTTRMFCAGKMEIERAFLDTLGAVRRFARDGARLVLADEDGHVLAVLNG